MNKVAILITNYNMPERTDALCKRIRQHVLWPYGLFVIDNGSDIAAPSQYTTLRLEQNIQTTGGWLAGLSQARGEGDYFAYWFLITSAEIAEGHDPLTPMAELLVDDPQAVGVHPALTEDSTTAWKHLLARGGDQPRRTWMIDNIASLWRAEWFNAQGGFDPELRYGWGIDLETCWKARQQEKTLWVHEGCWVKKVTDIGYTMGRMNMTAAERVRLAGENMDHVLRCRYGKSWDWKMRNEFITGEMA